MKIIRYQDRQGNCGHAALQADGSALKLLGDLFGAWHRTDETADVAKLLAPVAPAARVAVSVRVLVAVLVRVNSAEASANPGRMGRRLALNPTR